jgi:hypothetical protein
MSQFLTEAELTAVRRLVRHLNAGFQPSSGGELAVEARLIDSNGEHAGTVTIHDGGEYGLVFP